MMKQKRFFSLFLLIAISIAVLGLVSYVAQDFDSMVSPCYANGDDDEEFEAYIGYLSSRTERVGTRSEGPEYYLKIDGKEIHVIKNANLWEEDPLLQKFIDRKVWISGTLIDGELFYEEIKPAYG